MGAFLAVWVIGYGAVQASARGCCGGRDRRADRRATAWGSCWPRVPGVIASRSRPTPPERRVLLGLIAFGVVFALNSAVHSFLILHYADGDRVAMNVGFYYMANAARPAHRHRAVGAPLPVARLEACLWASVVFVPGRRGAGRALPAAVGPAGGRAA